ncbi:MAG: helix-turn-helix domain-containing protein [Candidatus Binatia bacterium]
MPYLRREPLDQLIAEAGMSFGEFARECGVSEPTLSKARHGRKVYPSTLRKLALGLSRIKRLKGLDADIVTVTKPITNTGTPPSNNIVTPSIKENAAAGKATAQGGIGDAVRHPVEA